MPFAARALRKEARRYRELARFINDPRTLAVLDEMAGDLEGKAEMIEENAQRSLANDKDEDNG